MKSQNPPEWADFTVAELQSLYARRACLARAIRSLEELQRMRTPGGRSGAGKVVRMRLRPGAMKELRLGSGRPKTR